MDCSGCQPIRGFPTASFDETDHHGASERPLEQKRLFDIKDQSSKSRNPFQMGKSPRQPNNGPRNFGATSPVNFSQSSQTFNTNDDYNSQRFRPEENKALPTQYLHPSDLDKSRVWMPPEYPNELPTGSISPKLQTPHPEAANGYTGVTLQLGQLPNLTTIGIAGGVFDCSPRAKAKTAHGQVEPVYHQKAYSPHQIRPPLGHPKANTIAQEGLGLENFGNSPQSSAAEAQSASEAPVIAFAARVHSFPNVQSQAGIRDWRQTVSEGEKGVHSVFDTRWILDPAEAWKYSPSTDSKLLVFPERQHSSSKCCGVDEGFDPAQHAVVDFEEGMRVFTKELDQEKHARVTLKAEDKRLGYRSRLKSKFDFGLLEPRKQSQDEKAPQNSSAKGKWKEKEPEAQRLGHSLNEPKIEEIPDCTEIMRLTQFVADISSAKGRLPNELPYDAVKTRRVFYDAVFGTTGPSALGPQERARLVKHAGKSVTYGWVRDFVLNAINDFVLWMTSPTGEKEFHIPRPKDMNSSPSRLGLSNSFGQHGGETNTASASNHNTPQPQKELGSIINPHNSSNQPLSPTEAQILAQYHFGGSFNPDHPLARSLANSYLGIPTATTQALPATRFGGPVNHPPQTPAQIHFGNPATADFVMNTDQNPQGLAIRQKSAQALQHVGNSELPSVSNQGVFNNSGPGPERDGSTFGTGTGSSVTTTAGVVGPKVSLPYGSTRVHLVGAQNAASQSNLLPLLQPSTLSYQANQLGQPRPLNSQSQHFKGLTQAFDSTQTFHGQTGAFHPPQNSYPLQTFTGQAQPSTIGFQSFQVPLQGQPFVAQTQPTRHLQSADRFFPPSGTDNPYEHGQQANNGGVPRHSHIPEGRWARPPAPGRIAPFYSQTFALQDAESMIYPPLTGRPDWQTRFGHPNGLTTHPAVLPYRTGSENMDPRLPNGANSMRYQNLTRHFPPKEAIACDRENLPFIETASLSKPAGWGVLKVQNIPYDITPAKALAFLGTHAKTITADIGPGVHIMMERSTGKTMDCYIEFFSIPDAIAWLSVIRSRPQYLNRVGERLLNVELSSQEELMKQLFPKARCVKWSTPNGNGNGVEVEETREAFDSGFKGFVSQEELGLLVRHAEQPHRSIYTQKCPSRPYTTMISILAKFPWHATTLYTLGTRNALFAATLKLVHILSNFLRRADYSASQTSPKSQGSGLKGVTIQPGENPHSFYVPNLSGGEMFNISLQNAGLNEEILRDVVLAGLNAYGFSDDQRWQLLIASQSVLGRQWIRVSNMSDGWPFETLGRKSGFEEDVVHFYAILIRTHPGIAGSNNPENAKFSANSPQPFGNLSYYYTHFNITENTTMAALGQHEKIALMTMIKEQCLYERPSGPVVE